MEVEKRFELIREVGEEIVTEEGLKDLLEKKKHPIAYDGFEPSGLAHIAFGVYRAENLKKMIEAGVRFKLLIADWHAWINDKMGGDLEKIKRVGKYFKEVWKAAGVPMDKVEVVWASEIIDQEYWETVIRVAKNHTLNRAQRALKIAGRKSAGENPAAWIIYPSMQVADIFHLDVDICQLGQDQRRANMLAREMAPKLGRKKPVTVSHHMLMGLGGEEGEEKMSKSKPSTSIYVHDSEEEILEKVKGAYCPEEKVGGNPIMDYTKHLVFRNFDEVVIERKEEYGGDLEFKDYSRLEKTYQNGELHPLDLKKNVARYLNQLVEPIRKHFEEDEEARKLYEFVKEQEITR